MIERVRASPDRFADEIKYDHHPHLLEIALAPSADLDELAARCHEVIDELTKRAIENGLTFQSVPFLDISGLDPAIRSPLTVPRALRRYRRKLLRQSGQATIWDNYAATIAATQTHVGGWSWMNRSDVIESLYTNERRDGLFAYEESGLSWRSAYHRRWLGYYRVFSRSPLVGLRVPRPWTLEKWFEALTVAPLAGLVDASAGGRSLQESGIAISRAVFDDIRDLQLIKPRLFGTVEFRGDPAQPNAASVVNLARFRKEGVKRALEHGAH